MANPRFRAAICVLLVSLAGVALPARAERIVIKSRSPYWAVGVRDNKLSEACSLGLFNAVRSDKLTAQFIGKQGAETLAIGRGNGTNLHDPQRLAKPNEDYYFRNGSTTSCEVFVGGRGKGPASGAR